jgi:CRP/FNR family transcriptional regulator, cyclic AMP receptor protein
MRSLAREPIETRRLRPQVSVTAPTAFHILRSSSLSRQGAGQEPHSPKHNWDRGRNPGAAGFDPGLYLTGLGKGRTTAHFNAKEFLFLQGGAADSVFYLQTGRAKLTVVSSSGKEATIMLFSAGDFMGEESLTTEGGVRIAAAEAVSTCSALRITRQEMMRVIQDEVSFSELFLKQLLARNSRAQANLIDQRFNFTEKRLARTLLMLAEAHTQDETLPLIPGITQEGLSAMIGTTRSRVNILMNRFRNQGLIEYNERIWVNKQRLDGILHAGYRGLRPAPEHA